MVRLGGFRGTSGEVFLCVFSSFLAASERFTANNRVGRTILKHKCTEILLESLCGSRKQHLKLPHTALSGSFSLMPLGGQAPCHALRRPQHRFCRSHSCRHIYPNIHIYIRDTSTSVPFFHASINRSVLHAILPQFHCSIAQLLA